MLDKTLRSLKAEGKAYEVAVSETIGAAMKFYDTITIGRVVPNATRRAEDSPPYQRCLTTYHCRSHNEETNEKTDREIISIVRSMLDVTLAGLADAR